MLRMLKSRKAALTTGVLLFCIAAPWSTYHDRFLISAKLWHWRYGDSAKVGKYIIPVPKSWRVVSHNQNNLLISDTGGAGVISVDQNVPEYLTSPDKLTNWESLTTQSFRHTGVEPSRQSFLIVDKAGVCLAGTALLSPGKPIPVSTSSTDSLVRADCAFVGSLTVMFAGKQSMLAEFYRIVGGITK